MAYICLFIVLGGFCSSLPTGWGLVASEARASAVPLPRACSSLIAHRSCGFAAVTDSAIYLQPLSHEPMSRAQCGPWPAPVIAHASSLSP